MIPRNQHIGEWPPDARRWPESGGRDSYESSVAEQVSAPSERIVEDAMTTELQAHEYRPVAELVEAGKSLEEAIAQVRGQAAQKAPPRKANTEPATKKKLAAWLEERVDVEREYRFHPDRKWRFDYYLPAYRIAVEYEGFMTAGANVGHASISGIMRDVDKYNAATEMGIRVFRASAENIRTGAFFALLERVLDNERDVTF